MMHASLVAARTVAPPAQELVPRPRLLDRLDAGARGTLTLIAAPAGAGKTALTSAWATSKRPPGPVAWVSLDGDRVSHRDFWRLVGHALPAARGVPQPRSLQGFLDHVTASARPTVVVLDDVHTIDDANVLADLEALLTGPPLGLRLVLLTRHDPPLRLSRLRLSHDITEIRADELAFTAEEAERLLAGTAALTSHDVRALLRRTEGWVAALRLAELTLRDHPDPAGFVREFTGDDASVADYILSEVLDRFPAAVREFLLTTSLSDAICGGLADAITGRPGGAAMLRRLARDNAMVVPIESSPGWFRYHPLMRDLLRVELRYERDDVRELDRRAAEWLARNGDLLSAIRLAVRAEAWELAARILADGWVDLLLFGDVGPVRGLAARLGEPLVERWPELQLALAAAHLEAGDAARAEAAIDRARTDVERIRPERREIFDVALRTVELRALLATGRLEPPEPPAPRSSDVTVPPRPALLALEHAHCRSAPPVARRARLGRARARGRRARGRGGRRAVRRRARHRAPRRARPLRRRVRARRRAQRDRDRGDRGRRLGPHARRRGGVRRAGTARARPRGPRARRALA